MDSPDQALIPEGWYCFVDKFREQNVQVFTFPGQGYFSYYQCLFYLKANNNFPDEIWIQETFEPRFSFLDIRFFNPFKDEFENPKKIPGYENFSKRCFSHHFMNTIMAMQDMDKSIFNSYYKNTTFMEKFVKVLANEIQEECKKHGISGYVWSMDKPIMKCRHFKRIEDLEFVHEMLKLRNYLTSDHPGAHGNLQGNKFIADFINKKLFYE